MSHNARKERAAIMEQSRKSEEKKTRPALSREARSVKTASSVSSASSRPKEPIYYSANGMVGTGLWCHPTSSSLPVVEEREPSPQKPVTTELTADIEKKVTRELVSTLEKKATKLAAQLDKEILSKRELELKIQQLQQTVDEYQHFAEAAHGQIENVEGKNSQLEQEMDQHALYRNYATTQIDHLNKELESERARAEAYFQMYEELSKRHEDELAEYVEEVESLKQRLEAALEECSRTGSQLYELKAQLDIQEQDRQFLGEKLTEEVASAQTIEEKAKNKASKINILIGENHLLTQRVKELEEGKRKAHESVKRREEEIKEMKTSLESAFKRLKVEQDLKKHQSDLVAQRDYRLKLLEDRYEKVQLQIEDLLKENERLKEVLDRKPPREAAKVVKEREEVVPVKVNPSLFL